MVEPKWSLSGEYMESCNCGYLCPCIYTNPQGPATNDNCIAVMVFRIDEGRFGETRLDGLKFALVIRSGKVMADGNWLFGGIVDERAEETQRVALAAVVGGEAGGTPAVIRQNMVSDFRGIEFRRIESMWTGFTARPRSRTSSLSKSKASRRAIETATRSISTTPHTRQTADWRWPAPMKPMSMVSASTGPRRPWRQWAFRPVRLGRLGRRRRARRLSSSVSRASATKASIYLDPKTDPLIVERTLILGLLLALAATAWGVLAGPGADPGTAWPWPRRPWACARRCSWRSGWS